MELSTNQTNSAAIAGNAATEIIDAGFDINLFMGASAAPTEKTFIVSVLYDEDGNHKAGFEIVSKNSDQYRSAMRSTSVSAIKRGQTKKEQIDAKTDAGAGAMYDLMEDRNQKIAIAVVVGLPGFTDKGQPAAVSEQFLKAVFAKFPTWQEKILTALEADANFLTI